MDPYFFHIVHDEIGSWVRADSLQGLITNTAYYICSRAIVSPACIMCEWIVCPPLAGPNWDDWRLALTMNALKGKHMPLTWPCFPKQRKIEGFMVLVNFRFRSSMRSFHSIITPVVPAKFVLLNYLVCINFVFRHVCYGPWMNLQLIALRNCWNFVALPCMFYTTWLPSTHRCNAGRSNCAASLPLLIEFFKNHNALYFVHFKFVRSAVLQKPFHASRLITSSMRLFGVN